MSLAMESLINASVLLLQTAEYILMSICRNTTCCEPNTGIKCRSVRLYHQIEVTV